MTILALSAAALRWQAATPTPIPELQEAAEQASSGPTIEWSQWIWAGVVVVVGLGLATAMRIGIRRIFKDANDNAAAVQIISQLAFFTVSAIAAYIALIILGVNLTPILAGAGVASVVLGFALQDITSNYVSGVIIGFGHPFNPGDELVIDDGPIEGTVDELQLRYTVIRSRDGVQVMVPNASVIKSSIQNLTRNPRRRSEFVVRVALDEDMNDAITVANEALARVEGVATIPPPDTFISEVTENWIHLTVRVWHNSARNVEHTVRSDATIAVFEALGDAGIATAYRGGATEDS